MRLPARHGQLPGSTDDYPRHRQRPGRGRIAAWRRPRAPGDRELPGCCRVVPAGTKAVSRYRRPSRPGWRRRSDRAGSTVLGRARAADIAGIVRTAFDPAVRGRVVEDPAAAAVPQPGRRVHRHLAVRRLPARTRPPVPALTGRTAMFSTRLRRSVLPWPAGPRADADDAVTGLRRPLADLFGSAPARPGHDPAGPPSAKVASPCWPTLPRPRMRWASCSSDWERAGCCGAPTACSTARRKPRSWRSAPSTSRPSTRRATVTRH